jgi:hypothetical protein
MARIGSRNAPSLAIAVATAVIPRVDARRLVRCAEPKQSHYVSSFLLGALAGPAMLDVCLNAPLAEFPVLKRLFAKARVDEPEPLARQATSHLFNWHCGDGNKSRWHASHSRRQ